MITEDYVSFKLAELLRDKGFNIQTQASITVFAGIPDGTTYVVNGEKITPKKDTIIPTLQTAMKWIREVHNLCIEPYRTAAGYLYTISRIWTGSCLHNPSEGGDDEDSGQWTTYEKACEAAIKYCLENLI